MVGNASFGWRNWKVNIQAFRMLMLNFVIDPIVYVLTRRQYRLVLRDVICRFTGQRVRRSMCQTSRYEKNFSFWYII